MSDIYSGSQSINYFAVAYKKTSAWKFTEMAQLVSQFTKTVQHKCDSHSGHHICRSRQSTISIDNEFYEFSKKMQVLRD